jgi:hypothetical protein
MILSVIDAKRSSAGLFDERRTNIPRQPQSFALVSNAQPKR